MIFSINELYQESYKERNLYYKIFAGYLFNELIPSYKQRKKLFFDLLMDQINSDQHFAKNLNLGKPVSEALKELSKENLHVSFDFHPKQVITDYPDRGEVSDVIIWGKQYFLSIEVKYLSDWTFKKDIEEVQARILSLGKNKKIDKQGIQVLLIKKSKWLNNEAKKDQTGSNYTMLKDNESKLKVPLLVITWNQILRLIEEPMVKNHLLNQLDRK